MYDRHYDYSPYVYVLNNPALNVDLYGFTDWATVLKGAGGIVSGAIMCVTGCTTMATPTGVGQVVGVGLFSAGLTGIGVGIATIVDGVVDDGDSNLPGGPGELGGIVGDQLLNNKNNELRNLGSVGDIVSGGAPKTAVEAINTGVQAGITVLDINDQINNNGSSENGSSSESNESTPDEKARASTNLSQDVNNNPSKYTAKQIEGFKKQYETINNAVNKILEKK